MTTFHAPLINAAGDLAATFPDKVGSWWFASKLHDDQSDFWVKIHTMEMQGACHSTVSLLQDPGGHTSEKHTIEDLHDVKVSEDSLNVQTSILTMSGDLDELEIAGATDTASVRLTLRRAVPVLAVLQGFVTLTASGVITAEQIEQSLDDTIAVIARGCAP
jgi:hypothetical protein